MIEPKELDPQILPSFNKLSLINITSTQLWPSAALLSWPTFGGLWS